MVILLAAAAGASATPSLSRVSCGHSAFSGSGTDACSVYLTADTTSAFNVTLKSNNPAVKVASGATVKAGALSTGFSASVTAVTQSQTAIITAVAGGISKTFSITLSPSAAVATATLSVNATSIGFGSTVVKTPVAQSVTLSSTGTAAVAVNSATVSGTGFSMSGPSLPATLSPGQSMTLELQFDPTTAGSYTGQLSIASSASNKTVPLSGTGTAAPANEVNLSWEAPAASSVAIMGYHVYRAPGGTTTYQLLNSSVDTQTTYTDGSVKAGSAYNYVVKSVDSAGVESAASNMTTVSVP